MSPYTTNGEWLVQHIRAEMDDPTLDELDTAACIDIGVIVNDSGRSANERVRLVRDVLAARDGEDG